MKNLIFKDDQFSFQLLRLLGEAVYKTSDIGEVLVTAEKIEEGNYESWYKEWNKTAERIHCIADNNYENGHTISAKEQYLRAANYYRIAEFYLHENIEDSNIERLYNLSFECFSKVMELNSPVIERVEIPYEKTTLPAHYYKLEDSNTERPVLVLMTGYDGTKEEFYGLAMTAIEHGFNCLAFEGPGQGEVVKKQHLYFRYDYEKVLTPVIDYLMMMPEINKNKIVVWGESLGGYLAPRALAFENRVACLVANGGVYDFLGGFVHSTPSTKEELINFAKTTPDFFNNEIYKEMKVNSRTRWGISHGMYVFGVKTPAELVLKGEKFSLEGVAQNIKCPTLIVDVEKDGLLGGQSKPLYDKLTCKKDYIKFKLEEGAGLHCQVGGKLISNESIFNWIEDTLRTK